MEAALARRVRDEWARSRIMPPGASVLALVSGGADSMCLMHLLARLHDGRVGVLAVDHGLRPTGLDEARAVAQAAAALGMAARVERLELPPGPGAMARARTARYAAARRVADELGYDLIATGHTASDQAETVLFRLARGSGRSGALGMAARRGRLVRPLLALTRADARAFCDVTGVAVVDDPTNADPAFARTRVRHGLLPALGAVHPGAERHVAAFAAQLRDEAAVVQGVVDAAWLACWTGAGLGRAALLARPAAVQRLLVRRQMAVAGLPADRCDRGHVHRILALCQGVSGRASLPGGGAAVQGGVLHVYAERPAPAEGRLPVPGEAAVAPGRIRSSRGPAGPPEPTRVGLRVAGPLLVRAPRPGDRIALAGGGHQAIGRLLAAAGVPAPLRPQVPVVVGDGAPGRVLWVAGHRAAADLLAAPGEMATILEVIP